MTATVTIEKAYFETLLRRAEFHVSEEDLSKPVDLTTVIISKNEHDHLLQLARDYATLRQALFRGGIAEETLDILVHGDAVPMSNYHEEPLNKSGGIALQQPSYSLGMPTPPTSYTPAPLMPYPVMRPHVDDIGRVKERIAQGRQPSFSHDDTSFPSDLERDEHCQTTPSLDKQHLSSKEQRTILFKNLSDRTGHKDIVDVIRGGAILDVYLRSNDKSASVSFVEGSAAQAWMNYVKRNDVYIHGKRVEFAWNERQFTLPGHVAAKIRNGATRNLVIRSVHPNITAERIREDLDHIHNLVVVDITFQNGDAIICLNSVHNSLFARTCMMSRATYKGARIEWPADECARPLPKAHFVSKKENVAPPVKKVNPMVNRFQMLNMDGTEDGSEEDEDDGLTSFTSLRPDSHWTASTVAA